MRWASLLMFLALLCALVVSLRGAVVRDGLSLLALALAATGATGIAATSAVLGYRLLTVWLPLAPGLLVLGLLVRRKLL